MQAVKRARALFKTVYSFVFARVSLQYLLLGA